VGRGHSRGRHRGDGRHHPAKKYTKQGDDLVLLVLFSVSQLGWYEYVTQWNFSDDGTVTAKVGATGDLSPGDYSGAGTGWPIGKGDHDHATNHYHSVFWRLNFDIDGPEGQGRAVRQATEPR
jgi:primary-amine oxidase